MSLHAPTSVSPVQALRYPPNKQQCGATLNVRPRKHAMTSNRPAVCPIVTGESVYCSTWAQNRCLVASTTIISYLCRGCVYSWAFCQTSKAQWSLYVPHSGRYMYHQFNIQQFYVLPTHCIYVFCVDLRTNSDYFTIQH
jgi:hypothetical protein